MNSKPKFCCPRCGSTDITFLEGLERSGHVTGYLPCSCAPEEGPAAKAEGYQTIKIRRSGRVLPNGTRQVIMEHVGKRETVPTYVRVYCDECNLEQLEEPYRWKEIDAHSDSHDSDVTFRCMKCKKTFSEH
jgi:hypothetical protein